ncbi:nucleotidyltransferase domain-containing protein [Nocardiopsis alkaliphila]|uniref:nucleotidyltransferase domain-containing protein n=1 Tax=Nocardiopsis alkaliphila TaxID=225762 RepID=UPI0003479A23|nr:nucleotidyltransferase domain-containing protein [Nocardiopsis alkaliphila]
MTPQPPPQGVRPDGTIAREGSLERIPSAFAPVITALRTRLPRLFGPRLHSAYLYGSIPRGTATPTTSDLDALALLHTPPTAHDQARAQELMTQLDADFTTINGGGILLEHTTSMLRPLSEQDGGFFVACLCTPLLGPDLAEQLPTYRPDSLLARQTNGDLHLVLPRWRHALNRADTDTTSLARRVGRRLVRTGFTLVMPTWGGWTSDLDLATDVFGHYHPQRHHQMRAAAHTAHHPGADPAHLHELVEDLAPWLETTYTATHGRKHRPDTS